MRSRGLGDDIKKTSNKVVNETKKIKKLEKYPKQFYNDLKMKANEHLML